MTGGTLAIELRDLPARWVTGSTLSLLVITAERPAGGSVREGRFLHRIVTLVTPVLRMTVIADGMNLFVGLDLLALLIKVVTVGAVLLLVTINTA